MRAQFAFSLNRFGPTRAEEITNVARVTQRDWRREGHLPASEGMARYDLFDLCELWVLGACAEFGLGPKRAKAFSRSAAIHMAWHCLHLIEAYEGDHLAAPASKHGGSLPPWGRKSRWLADHIVHGRDDKLPMSDCYGVFRDGKAMPMPDGISFFGSFRDPARRGGVFVIPLQLGARWLVDATDEPLVQVTFGAAE